MYNLSGIPGADKEVRIRGHLQSPVHPVGVGKCEEFMAFVFYVYLHAKITS